MIRDRVAGMMRRLGEAPHRAALLMLAVLAYVPILVTAPGRVSADTKVYLTLDPGHVVSSAASMWDPYGWGRHGAASEHRLSLPTRPVLLGDGAGRLPDWITQRLLWATMVFAAAYRRVPAGAPARLGCGGGARRRVGLRIHSVPAELSRPAVGHSRAVGGDAVDDPAR